MKNEFQNLPPELRQKVSNAIEEMNEPMTVEQVREMLLKNEKGTVKNTIGNCLTAFQHDPYLAGALAFNLLAVQTHIVKPLWYERHGGFALSDTDMTYIRLYLEETYGLTNEKKIEDAAVVAAHEHSFHPVRDFLNGLKWDGQERILQCTMDYGVIVNHR